MFSVGAQFFYLEWPWDSIALLSRFCSLGLFVCFLDMCQVCNFMSLSKPEHLLQTLN